MHNLQKQITTLHYSGLFRIECYPSRIICHPSASEHNSHFQSHSPIIFNIQHLCTWTSLRLLGSHSCVYNYLYSLIHNEFAFSHQTDLKQGWVLHHFCFRWTEHLVLQDIREHQDVFITKMGE